ncbi:lipopolysaccharide transport periplasmic protein LptA [Marilutibacter chinensis]|uniref:Lipopolysaccharide export system protein LptA n=1 Tax=Marilutibacter chinensis TaxID=2912247 RepID=A0ABS9HWP3_9GAMM|nr:lipopolysaccharide transport periplasmic protein LptA [Lysobacter chinensis]MCF7222472.1 lipopolysaccharide transport periplasmic protein LptA [Lysobacter chinensis]
MRTPNASRTALMLAALLLVALPAGVLARSSDRTKPMLIDADNVVHALDESQPTVLSGNVVITQGTLDIRSARADVSIRNNEPTQVVLTGNPARLKQEMDDGSPFSADASRIVYDLTTDTVTLTGNVTVNQRGNTMNGPRVVYNMKTGRVQATRNGTDSGRVSMRIEPKNPAPADQPESD